MAFALAAWSRSRCMARRPRTHAARPGASPRSPGRGVGRREEEDGHLEGCAAAEDEDEARPWREPVLLRARSRPHIVTCHPSTALRHEARNELRSRRDCTGLTAVMPMLHDGIAHVRFSFLATRLATVRIREAESPVVCPSALSACLRVAGRVSVTSCRLCNLPLLANVQP
jgi:hypothetical protein